jgi:capsular exopolysaccharide synthesis family protein
MKEFPFRRQSGMDAANLSDALVTVLNPGSAASEAYRTLRTNLLYSHLDTPLGVMELTSPGPREGKSIICANLGAVLAQMEKRTLIVDCDLRKPTMHKIFALHNAFGLVNVLVGERALQEVWQEVLAGLKVVTSGPIPPNPAEVLSSQRFTEFLASVRKDVDYVLLDAPPVQSASDPVIIATHADGVILVFDARNTRKGAVRQSVRALRAVGANMLGTVMNNVKEANDGYHHYHMYEGRGS